MHIKIKHPVLLQAMKNSTRTDRRKATQTRRETSMPTIDSEPEAEQRTRQLYLNMFALSGALSPWCLISDEKDELMKLYEDKMVSAMPATDGVTTPREQQIEQFA